MRDEGSPAWRVLMAADEPLIGPDRYDYADAFEIHYHSRMRAQPSSRSVRPGARPQASAVRRTHCQRKW